MGFDLESVAEATSGAVGALVSTTILYPLDTCKTKYQAEVRAFNHQKYRFGFFFFFPFNFFSFGCYLILLESAIFFAFSSCFYVCLSLYEIPLFVGLCLILSLDSFTTCYITLALAKSLFLDHFSYICEIGLLDRAGN